MTEGTIKMEESVSELTDAKCQQEPSCGLWGAIETIRVWSLLTGLTRFIQAEFRMTFTQRPEVNNCNNIHETYSTYSTLEQDTTVFFLILLIVPFSF